MTSGCYIVVIGGSWGGMRAVGEILHALPADFPAPVVVVLHRGEGASDTLAPLLDRRSSLRVSDVVDKAPLVGGTVSVAPAGYHVLIEPGHTALSTEPAVRYSRPSIDLALESAADAYGSGVVAVVVTGSNEDGAAGLAAVRRRGGYAIVQDPATAERSAMPEAAIAAANPQAVLPLERIAPRLVRLSAAVSS